MDGQKGDGGATRPAADIARRGRDAALHLRKVIEDRLLRMKKIYVFAPLAGIVLFGAAYWRFEQAYVAREEQRARELRAAVDAKLMKNAADQAKAQADALAARAKRQQEKAAADRLAEAQREARDDAERRRVLAGERARKLQAQVDRLKIETENARQAVAAAEESRRVLRDEHAFLLRVVDEAEANRKAFFELLERMERIEKTRETPRVNS